MAGKRYIKVKELVKPEPYSMEQAFGLLLTTATAKFDESVDVAFRLGIDAKQGDQQVRGAVSLPHGLGKTVRVVVFAKGPKEADAKGAGADFVGAEDLVAKITGGWLDFDKVIATPDMMATVSKVAKILGPRGLMPNPKVGTVTLNVAEAVAAEKKGKLDFRNDKTGIIHAVIGKKSMGQQKLQENFQALLEAVIKGKPSSSKGIYLKAVALSSTMGPGIKLDIAPLVK
jgi:large subunit ribosomal protein L1